MAYIYIIRNKINNKYKSGNEIAYFPLLVGIGACKVNNTGDVRNEHNYQAVIDAINKYYLNTKDTDMINGFETGLLEMINSLSNTKNLQTVIDIVFYQLKLEKEDKSSFKMNSNLIIDKLNCIIKEKYNAFRKNDTSFLGMMNIDKEYAMKMFNITLG